MHKISHQVSDPFPTPCVMVALFSCFITKPLEVIFSALTPLAHALRSSSLCSLNLPYLVLGPSFPSCQSHQWCMWPILDPLASNTGLSRSPKKVPLSSDLTPSSPTVSLATLSSLLCSFYFVFSVSDYKRMLARAWAFFSPPTPMLGLTLSSPMFCYVETDDPKCIYKSRPFS